MIRFAAKKSHPSFLFLMATILFFGSLPLFAGDEERQFLEWSAVSDTSSYVVEIQEKGTGKTILNERVTTNKIELQLPPGNYSQRVGVINKFGKVSAWSPWRPYSVVPTAKPVLERLEIKEKDAKTGTQKIVLEGKNINRQSQIRVSEGDKSIPVRNVEETPDGKVVVTVDMSEERTGDYRIHVENPGGRKVSSSSHLEVDEEEDALVLAGSGGFLSMLFGGEETVAQESGPSGTDQTPGTDDSIAPSRYSLLVPGLYAMQEGSYLRGAGWMSSFVLFAGAGYSGWQSANQAALAISSDPIRIMYSNQYIYNQVSPLISSNEMEFYLLHSSFQNYQRQKTKYKNGQALQKAAGAAAALTYMGHLYLENPDAWTWTTPIPGVPQFSEGRYIAGSAISGLTLAASAGLASEWQAANQTAKKIETDLFYQYTSNPIMTRAIAPVFAGIAPELVTLYSYNQYRSLKEEYRSHQTNQARIGGVLLATYLYHLIDATIVQNPVAATDSNVPESTSSGDVQHSVFFGVIPTRDPMAVFQVSLYL